MSENKHQLMLRDLRRIDNALFDLRTTILLNQATDDIKRQANVIEGLLNTTMNTANTALQKEGVTWDSVLLAMVQFVKGMVDLAENNLRHIMVQIDIPLDSKEVIH
jgi:hypothetical protein